MSEKKVSTKTKLSFAIGNIGGLAIGQASILLLYSYYFLYLKVPLSPIGISLILMVYGIWDALNEPLIGHISDNTRTRWGRRKPFIIIGMVPLIIFSFLIFTPPTNDPIASTVYLVIILILYETFVTMVVTIWYSLFPEITLDQNERLSVSKYLQIFGIFGLIIGTGVAPLIAGMFPEAIVGYSIMGIILGILTALSMIPTILNVKERKEYQIIETDKINFFKSIKILGTNRTFVYFVLIQFLLQLSYSLVLTSLPLFFEGILGMGALEYSIQLLLIFTTVIPGLYLWISIASKKGTKYALFISMIAFCVVFPFVFLVNNPFTILVLLLIAGIGLGGLMLFPTILLSDVIDEDQLTTGKRREGIYNGMSGVIVKLANAISWLLVGIILTLFQIDRNSLNPSTISDMNALGLRVLLGALPPIVILLGLLFLHFYPLAGEKLMQVKEKVKILNEKLVDSKN